MSDYIIGDYQSYKAAARQWARRAIDERRSGLDWTYSKTQAREMLGWALLIIGARGAV